MRRPALALIRFYQHQVSPGRPPACRFEPTCSSYAYEAIDTRGLLVGVTLAFWRVLRCNPLNDGGYDPVPERGGHRHHPSRG
ncbi:MAG: membrane protein insertion efficiency factor YidD [Dehalococcoidia bacterium]